VALSSSASDFPFSPLSGIPPTLSATGLYDFYGLPPADGSVLFNFSNAPYAVFYAVPEVSLVPHLVRQDEVARRNEEVRRRQVLLVGAPVPAGAWPFASGGAGDAARMEDARQVYAALERCGMLVPASGDSVRMLFRLSSDSYVPPGSSTAATTRVVLQLAGEGMVGAMQRRDPHALHELGWALQRADGSWLVPPRPTAPALPPTVNAAVVSPPQFQQQQAVFQPQRSFHTPVPQPPPQQQQAPRPSYYAPHSSVAPPPFAAQGSTVPGSFVGPPPPQSLTAAAGHMPRFFPPPERR
jgi:hypothetical protein